MLAVIWSMQRGQEYFALPLPRFVDMPAKRLTFVFHFLQTRVFPSPPFTAMSALLYFFKSKYKIKCKYSKSFLRV